MSDVNKSYTIELTLEELQLINTALKKLPYKDCKNLLDNLKEQYNYNMKLFKERLNSK